VELLRLLSPRRALDFPALLFVQDESNGSISLILHVNFRGLTVQPCYQREFFFSPDHSAA
jgi:hypothetical protein